jgi:tRNA pseudouridine55 synthase
MHSAIKHRGRPLYAYARKGETVERTARKVVIRELVLERFEGTDLELRIACSKGTYVRALAEDIGEALDCGAHLAALQRTVVGPFRLDRAISIDALGRLSPEERKEELLPVEALIGSRPRVALDAAAAARFRQGQRVVPAQARAGSVAVFGADGGFLGIGEIDGEGVLHPKRLMRARGPAETS